MLPQLLQKSKETLHDSRCGKGGGGGCSHGGARSEDSDQVTYGATKACRRRGADGARVGTLGSFSHTAVKREQVAHVRRSGNRHAHKAG